MLKEGHTDADVVDMVKEMEIMKSVGSHPNVIGFLGSCTRPAGRPLLIVVEYAANKNLREFLHAHRPRPTASAANRWINCTTLLFQFGIWSFDVLS